MTKHTDVSSSPFSPEEWENGCALRHSCFKQCFLSLFSFLLVFLNLWLTSSTARYSLYFISLTHPFHSAVNTLPPPPENCFRFIWCVCFLLLFRLPCCLLSWRTRWLQRKRRESVLTTSLEWRPPAPEKTQQVREAGVIFSSLITVSLHAHKSTNYVTVLVVFWRFDAEMSHAYVHRLNSILRFRLRKRPRCELTKHYTSLKKIKAVWIGFNSSVLSVFSVSCWTPYSPAQCDKDAPQPGEDHPRVRQSRGSRWEYDVAF